MRNGFNATRTATVVKHRLVPAIVARVPVSALQRLLSSPPLIAYYHVVSDDSLPHIRHLYRFRSVAEFVRDLDTFLRRYRCIALSDVIEALRRDTPLPPNAFHLTFDDGFRQMHDVVAPLLLAKGVPATFFLTTSFIDNRDLAHDNRISLLLHRLAQIRGEARAPRVERMLRAHGCWRGDIRTSLLGLEHRQRHVVDGLATILDVDFPAFLARYEPYLRSTQVDALLAQGFAVGAHSVNHPSYAELPREEQLVQTRLSVEWIRERFGVPYGAFAFPYGGPSVGRALLDELFTDGSGLDVTFGTAGMVRGRHPRHLERCLMENSPASAVTILAQHYARAMYRHALRRSAGGVA
jgi:peptidoglycan/xylan/chitin deacetylase (PgdA/CDA1 family)